MKNNENQFDIAFKNENYNFFKELKNLQLTLEIHFLK